MFAAAPAPRPRLQPPAVLLAPMAGVTDLPFRTQAQAFGATYCVSEMIASEQLSYARPDMLRRAAGAGLISPLVIQLAGRETRWLARGAELAEAAGADVIDINMGCPAKMVTNGASGSALMRDPAHAEALIRAAAAATDKPVTVKIRLGWDEGERNAAEIAKRAEGAGAAMVTVHGRTRQQFYTGTADWAAIGAVVRAVSIPVIANGDIASAAHARAAVAASGAAGVMIGRGAQGRPWLAGAIEAALRAGGEIQRPPLERILQSLLALYGDSLAHYGEKLGGRIARKHIAWTIDAEFGASPEIRAARRALCVEEDSKAVEAGLRSLFARAAGANPWREAA